MKSDQQLINELKANQHSAMGALYSKYFEKVYGRCLSITKNESDAYDCANDAILISFEKINSFQEKSSYSTWLFAIATNYTLSYCKQLNKTFPIDKASIEAEFTPEEYELIPQKSISEILETILDSISIQEKELLLEKYRYNKSIQELEQKYGSGASAIKMRLNRAKKKVQELYLKQVAFSA